MSRHDI
nr:unknown [Zea mays]